MFFPFILLIWIVLVALALAAFADAVEECQAKGSRTERPAMPKTEPAPRVHHVHLPLLHHSH